MVTIKVMHYSLWQCDVAPWPGVCECAQCKVILRLAVVTGIEVQCESMAELWETCISELMRVFKLYATVEAGTALTVDDFLSVSCS